MYCPSPKPASPNHNLNPEQRHVHGFRGGGCAGAREMANVWLTERMQVASTGDVAGPYVNGRHLGGWTDRDAAAAAAAALSGFVARPAIAARDTRSLIALRSR